MTSTDPELIGLVIHGREERNLEYKGPVQWDSYKSRLTKCILALANIRDGGAIAIGVAENSPGAFSPVGLSAVERDGFTQDGVASFVNEYADPYVELTVRHVAHDRMDFVVIQIVEFEHLPVICRRDHSDVMRRGAMYTRPRRMNECAEVPGQAEMREIIDMASEKGMRYLSGQASRAGYTPLTAGDSDRLDEELNGL
jgi:hypothetical protein